jgi:large subunit ribosomal protein L25
MVEVEVACLPKDLPEFLEVDLSTLELDFSLHMSDITLPAGVEIVELSHGEAHDQPIAACHMARGSKVDEAADAAEGGEPAAE